MTEEQQLSPGQEFAQLTGFQRDIVRLMIEAEEANGQQIQQMMESFIGKEVNHGRIYPNLDTLVDGGYLDKGQYDRRTNKYEITELARERARDYARVKRSIVESAKLPQQNQSG